MTCTFTNTADDLIVVGKVTHPAGGINFDFTANWGDFSLNDGDLEVQTLTPDNYTITEADPGPDDALTYLECGVFGPGVDDISTVEGNLDARSVICPW
ncbi:MAG: hypothetical protein R3C44_15410 [Chloroflexota bacterium]